MYACVCVSAQYFPMSVLRTHPIGARFSVVTGGHPKEVILKVREKVVLLFFFLFRFVALGAVY